MELRAFAEQVLYSGDIAVKTQRPATSLTDVNPGQAVKIPAPARPANLQFAPRRTAPPMPKPGAFADETKRAIAHHIMANHELQALEVMAMVLLAFPAAPADFRMGMARIMFDEQRHTRLHAQRASELGAPFGSYPVNSYIWSKATEYECVLDYIAGLPLVFRGQKPGPHPSNLKRSFCITATVAARPSCGLFTKMEIRHVEFGMQWLRNLKPPHLSDFEAWQKHLRWPIRPSKAVGNEFQGRRPTAGRYDSGIYPVVDRLEGTGK